MNDSNHRLTYLLNLIKMQIRPPSKALNKFKLLLKPLQQKSEADLSNKYSARFFPCHSNQ